MQGNLPVYFEKDCDPALLKSRLLLIIGYGNQGRAQALNLRDEGADVIVATRPHSAAEAQALQDGFEICEINEGAARADILMLLAPDELQANLYRAHIAPHLKAGAALGFAHGLNIHFGLIEARPDLDVFLVAPKGPGHALRDAYIRGGGLPCLAAVAQDASGQARALALAYAAGMGGGRAGIIETSFGDECETDLFGEQAVLCGGIPALILAGYETLVEAGYPPELAYFECVTEAKLITDLIHARGMAGMRQMISNTAEYGGYTRGVRLVTDDTKREMKAILAEIRSGAFAREFMGGNQEGLLRLKDLRSRAAAHESEAVGQRLQSMSPRKADNT